MINLGWHAQCSFISDLFWMLLLMYSWVVFRTELTWYNYNTIQYNHLFYCYTAPASFVVCQWWAVIRFLLVRCMLNKLACSWNRSGASGLYLSSYPCLLCSGGFSVFFFLESSCLPVFFLIKKIYWNLWLFYVLILYSTLWSFAMLMHTNCKYQIKFSLAYDGAGNGRIVPVLLNINWRKQIQNVTSPNMPPFFL